MGSGGACRGRLVGGHPVGTGRAAVCGFLAGHPIGEVLVTYPVEGADSTLGVVIVTMYLSLCDIAGSLPSGPDTASAPRGSAAGGHLAWNSVDRVVVADSTTKGLLLSDIAVGSASMGPGWVSTGGIIGDDLVKATMGERGDSIGYGEGSLANITTGGHPSS